MKEPEPPLDPEPFAAGSRGLPAAPASCAETRSFLHRLVEGELEAFQARRLALHLGGCAACRGLEAGLREERRWFVEVALKCPPLSDRFRKKVIARIQRQTAAARSRRWSYGLLGAAAALALAAVVSWQALLAPPEGAPVAVAPPPAPAVPVSGALPSPEGEDALSPPVVSLAAARVADPEAPLGDEPADLDLPLDEEPEECLAIDGELGGLAVPAFALLQEEEEGAASAESTLARRRVRQASLQRVRTFGRVMVLTSALGASSRRVAQAPGSPPASAEENPCPDDPNDDGKTDFVDVTFYCQFLMNAHLPDGLVPGEGSAEEKECEEPCVGV
jgi:hypothetical protein